MLPRHNTTRRLAATLGLLVAVCGVPQGLEARQDAPGQPAAAAGPLDPAPPDPAASMALYRTVEAWVRDWRVPMDPAGQRPLAAAAVTLRREGLVVGRGVSVSPDPAGGAGVLMLATKAAMDEARAKLPVERGTLEQEGLRAFAPSLTISVELAGQPVPIQPVEAQDLVAMVAPGLEGVAVRLGERMEAMFPERMLTAGMDASVAAGAAVSKASRDPLLSLEKPGDLRSKHGAVYYRFAVSHLAQTEAGGTPVFLHRGGRVVSMREMDAAGLRAWADQLAAHLIPAAPPDQHFGPTPGTLDPLTGERDPEAADMRAAALVGGALLRYSRSPAADPDEQRRALAAAEYVLTGLCEKYEDGSEEVEPVAAALTQWAMDLYRSDPAKSYPDSRLAHVEQFSLAALWGGYEEAKAGPDGKPATPRFIPLQYGEDTWKGGSGGAIAAGMTASAAEIARPEAFPDAPKVAAGAVRKTFLATPAAQLVSQMPWLGWAELRLSPTGDVPAAAALREMRAMVWQNQLKREDLPAGSEDLAGGIMFTASKQPLPTWQSARPLAFVATMLGDPRLTSDAEVPGEVAKLLGSLRFLRQLTASEVEARMYVNPGTAVGGVRSSLFDQRMPPDATAMTLLTVCETLKSLDAIQARRQGK